MSGLANANLLVFIQEDRGVEGGGGEVQPGSAQEMFNSLRIP